MKRKRRETPPRTAKKKPLPEKMGEKKPGPSKSVFNFIEEPETPTPTPKMWSLKINEEDWLKSKIILYSTFDVIQKIKNKLTSKQLEMFRKTCFGHFLDANAFQFSGQIVHHILLREVEQPNVEEMWFDICGMQLRFSMHEFALITGLKCFECPKVSRVEISGNRFLEKYFPRKKVSRELVDKVFDDYDGSNDEDCVKLAQLHLLENMLLAKEKQKLVDLEHIRLLDFPEIFNNYPWGRVCYSYTLGYLQRALANRVPKFKERQRRNPSHHCETYHLAGFPFALQVWAYESIPALGKLFAEKKGSNMPRILNWGETQQPNWKMIQKSVFARDEVEVVILKPTKLEKKADYMNKAVTKKTPDKGYLTASLAKAIVAHSDDENHTEFRPRRGSSAVQFDIKQEFSSFRDEMRGVLTSLKEQIVKINEKVTSLDVDKVEMGKKLTNVVNALYDIESELKSGESRFEILHKNRKMSISSKDKGVHEVEEDNGDNDDNKTAKENGDKMQLDFDQPIRIGVRGNQSNSFGILADCTLNVADDDSMQDNQRGIGDDAVAEMPKETNKDEMVQQIENIEEQSLDKIEGHLSQQEGHKETGLSETNPSLGNILVEVPENQDEIPPIQEDVQDNVVMAIKQEEQKDKSAKGGEQH
ncbi:uncharacterized protein LOC133802459 [Humulus lupulus]|uniref:uncharacterized protein LOC133802459 n=1 Tax=Humulus lupulus TaxID=3486 RepID=UPI002B4134F3|nr:uncharacterized protein LOC133802459 [Humulus lupulus]